MRDVTPSAARPARRVKKTQIDSESSSSESEESSVGSAGSSSDEGDEMVVLDPDHVSRTNIIISVTGQSSVT